MTSAQIEIQLVAAVVAVACALPGCFLVLRRLALVSDAVSHAVLLGIVVAFLVVRDLSSPVLLVGAALTGLLTVWLVELLKGTGLVREDAAIGLVFPALFSGGVILIARFADSVHLDTDVVLLGELAFAPLERFVAFGWDWGPEALVEMCVILLVNVVLIALLYKELKLVTFDPALALAIGFSPALLHYGLMGLVSLTAVGAFDAVGSILVVALMIGPPATAYLLTDRLGVMLAGAAALGAVAAILGYWLAHWLDASIAGSIATVVGAEVAAAVLFSPRRGVVAAARRRARQRWEFAHAVLAIHLLHHEGRPEAAEENRVEHLDRNLRWAPAFAERVVEGAERRRLVVAHDGALELTDRGRALARRALAT
jgi:manganese/zinc/iron transport system permease protein